MLSDIKTIMIGLTAVRDASEPVAALPYGLSMALAAGAHVDIRSAAIKLIIPSGYIYDAGADLLASENERLRAVAEALADTARREANKLGVPADIASMTMLYDDVDDDFVGRARVADLAIVDASNGIMEIDRGLVESLLFKAGGPVIIVPAGRTTFAARRCVVAWDGSSRAARAVKDAMPFLKTAEDVLVVTVSGESEKDHIPGSDVATMLARHGLRVSLADIRAIDGDAGEALRTYAAQQGADLLVMGAYAHSRLWQMVLGGVTQTMLKTCPVPLLMSY